jgi:hypothetical protein
VVILGAQIPLGFQFRGVFSDGYEQLPTELRYLDGLALAVMVWVVGLLISPTGQPLAYPAVPKIHSSGRPVEGESDGGFSGA